MPKSENKRSAEDELLAAILKVKPTVEMPQRRKRERKPAAKKTAKRTR